MSLYVVHFTWKEKEMTLKARSLDLTHPYFVSIRDLVLPTGQGLIIDPSEDDVRKIFGRADHVMLPFQTVSLIEERSSEPENEESREMPFSVERGQDSDEQNEDQSNTDRSFTIDHGQEDPDDT
ncbi:MAG: DUF1820 family protein [Spirochaetales bacterium]|nr:DUF1820 family protein [Spirochaetales bacterium]MCF7936989.1 DUF1820 family protein [Spirochaetales bacterium]